jgi:hypothetical protein
LYTTEFPLFPEPTTANDASLAHDDMSEPNLPVYFHEFVADAAGAGSGTGVLGRLKGVFGRFGRLPPLVQDSTEHSAPEHHSAEGDEPGQHDEDDPEGAVLLEVRDDRRG